MKIKCEIPFNIESRNGVIYTKDSFKENNYTVPLYLGMCEDMTSYLSEAYVDVQEDKLIMQSDITNCHLDYIVEKLSFAPRCSCELVDDKVTNATIISMNLIRSNECAINSKCKIEK